METKITNKTKIYFEEENEQEVKGTFCLTLDDYIEKKMLDFEKSLQDTSNGNSCKHEVK